MILLTFLGLLNDDKQLNHLSNTLSKALFRHMLKLVCTDLEKMTVTS